MVSINKLKGRKPKQNNSNSIYQQYIDEYKYYFNNALNKCDYIDNYDESIKGECVLLDVSAFNQVDGDEKYITTLPDSKIELGTVLKLDFAKEETSSWFVYDEENLVIPSHKKFKISPRNFEVTLIKRDGTESTINTKIKNNDKNDLATKYIYISKKDNVENGDLIQYPQKDVVEGEIEEKEKLYLVTEIQNFIRVPFVKSSECNQTFKWKDEYGIHEYPCVTSNDSYGVKQSTSSGTLTELEIKLKIKIQNNEDTRKLMPNLRIMFSHSKTDIYKIISVNKSIYEGVITITCVNDEYRPLDDDLENNLCSQNDSNNSNNNTPIEPTDYEIIGENSFKHLTQSVYTLNPVNNNCVWSLDQDSIDLEIARIDSQDSTSCTIYGYQTSSSEFFTLYAKDGDNVLAEKTITIKKYM